jgi:hypothetical protein
MLEHPFVARAAEISFRLRSAGNFAVRGRRLQVSYIVWRVTITSKTVQCCSACRTSCLAANVHKREKKPHPARPTAPPRIVRRIRSRDIQLGTIRRLSVATPPAICPAKIRRSSLSSEVRSWNGVSRCASRYHKIGMDIYCSRSRRPHNILGITLMVDTEVV